MASHASMLLLLGLISLRMLPSGVREAKRASRDVLSLRQPAATEVRKELHEPSHCPKRSLIYWIL